MSKSTWGARERHPNGGSLLRKCGRLFTVLCVFFGLSIMVVGAASAHTGTLNASASCDKDSGTYTVTYSGQTSNVPASGKGHTATFSVGEVQPSGSTISGAPDTVVGNTGYSFQQTGIPGDSTYAQATAYLKWGDGASSDPQGTIKLGGDCTKPPTKSFSASVSGSVSCVDGGGFKIPATVTYSSQGYTSTAALTITQPSGSEGGPDFTPNDGTGQTFSHTFGAYTATGTYTLQVYSPESKVVATNSVVVTSSSCKPQEKTIAVDIQPSKATCDNTSYVPIVSGDVDDVTITPDVTKPIAAGDSVTYTVTAKDGFVFEGGKHSFQVTLSNNFDVKSCVKTIAVNLTSSTPSCSNPSETVSASGDTADVTITPSFSPIAAGSSVTYTVTAKDGFVFADESHSFMKKFTNSFDTASCTTPPPPPPAPKVVVVNVVANGAPSCSNTSVTFALTGNVANVTSNFPVTLAPAAGTKSELVYTNKGYIFPDGKTVATVVIFNHFDTASCTPKPPVPPVCDKGQILQNGKCVTPTPVPPTCKANETLVNGKCVVPVPTCKSGYQLNAAKNDCVPCPKPAPAPPAPPAPQPPAPQPPAPAPAPWTPGPGGTGDVVTGSSGLGMGDILGLSAIAGLIVGGAFLAFNRRKRAEA